MTAPISTTAPMPALGSLFGGGTILDDAALTLPWRRSGEAAISFSRASWAIRAIVDGFTQADGSGPRLWVPDYFCNSGLTLVRNSVPALSFYPVTEQFVPDWDACWSMARQAPPRLFLQVHYFGWPSDTEAGRAFCDAHGAALIEDATHALIASDAIGFGGDYTIWSLYKHLPIPDGGILVARRKAPAQDAVLGAARDLAAGEGARTDLWRFRRLLQLLAPGLVSQLSRRQTPSFDTDPGPVPPGPPRIGRLSRRLVGSSIQNLPEIAERRCTNEAALRAVLGAHGGLRAAFPPAARATPPYRAVFRANSTEQARFWYARLTRAGSVVETWPDLPPEIHLSPDRHAAALALRATCLALPVHADRMPGELVAAYGEAGALPAASASAASVARAAR